MQGYLYMEDRGESGHGQRWGTPVTPLARKLQAPASRGDVMPRKLIALDKAALGVSEDWRDRDHRIALKCTRRKESSVRVVARFRPPSAEELEAEVRDEMAFRVRPGSRCVEVLDGPQSWEFDVAFGEDCPQEAIYDAAGRPVISGILDGYNGTIFAYGQTGSGKTHTMFGPSQDHSYQAYDSSGIVPRAAQHVFDHIRDGIDGTEFVLRCSLFEVYREQLRDLLDPANPNLRIKETPRQGVFVDGLAQEFVACEDDVVRLLRAGTRLRAVAATRLNQRSSRSHVIFSLTCEQRLADGTEKLAKLNLVDLAGSEKVWKSSSSGVTLEEAKKINLSLSALGNVINALASRRGHVPYRNSKLTRILQETLGGNFKTALVVTCSPLRMHRDETLSSLNFATCAKAVCNHVKVNFVYSAEQLMSLAEKLQQELLMTKQAIARHNGGAIPTSLPQPTAAVCDMVTAKEKQLYWDAPSQTPTPMPKQKHARVLCLADETTMPTLRQALKDHEDLTAALKQVKGQGLARELRTSAAALFSNAGCTSARQPSQGAKTWEQLLIPQRVLHKLFQRHELEQQLAAIKKSYREVGARQEQVTRYREHLETILAQMSLDLQHECDTLAERQHSPTSSPSRAHTPRERRLSAGSDVSVVLQRPHWPNGAGGGDEVAQSSSLSQLSHPNICESLAAASKALSMDLPGSMETEDPKPLGDNEAEVNRLKHELEMQKLEFEREKCWQHIRGQEREAEQQQWCEWAHEKLAKMDHFQEQTVFEEQRLQGLLDKRQTEISKTWERVALRQQEVLTGEHECIVKTHYLKLHNVAAEHADNRVSDEYAQMWSKRDEVDHTIARLKAKRAALQNRSSDQGPWSPMAAGA